jgi:hypothetical protein
MKRFALTAAGFAIAATFAAGAATAHGQTGDSVTGSATIGCCNPGSTTLLDFDAHSGPSGENPAGTATATFRGTLGGTVTCLNVTGNRATIGTIGGFLFAVEDNGVGADVVTLGALSLTPPIGPATDCSTIPIVIIRDAPISSGDIVVTDAPPLPSAKDQCKDGGWQSYGGTFKNQGQCAAFVERGPKASA